MKNLVLILSLVTAVFTNAQASQMPIGAEATLFAHLDTFDISHDQFFGVNFGSVTVDSVNSEVTLELMSVFKCDPGKLCPKIAPLRHLVTLPLVDSYYDGCGSKVFIAELDKRPVDGNFSALKVADHSTMLCDIDLNYVSEVEYTTISARGNILTQSYFTGSEFGPLYVLHDKLPDFPSMPPVVPFPAVN